jgi:N utilization substance protein A
VIVPDDQLSLAIGREGQNARLAAKLTGWRIDIKSLTEAAADGLQHLGHPEADKQITSNQELVEKVEHVLAKKQAARPVTAEDYHVLDRFVAGVEGRIIQSRSAGYEDIRKERAEARKQVPAYTWDLELEELNLPLGLHTTLMENDVTTVGEVLYRLEVGPQSLTRIEGVDERSIRIIRDAMAEFQREYAERAQQAEAVMEVSDAAVEEVFVVSEAESLDEALEGETVYVEAEEAEMAPALDMTDAAFEFALFEEALEEIPEELSAEVSGAEAAELPEIDDLSVSLVREVLVEPEKKAPAEKKVVVVARPAPDVLDESEDASKKRQGAKRGKQLVFDENAGRVVVQRKRKGSRRRSKWDDIGDGEDLDAIIDDSF